MRFVKYYLLSFLSISTLSFSQIRDLNFRNYTVADGLPSNETYRVLQDKNGYVWVSTDGGVCRFDGKKIIKYTTDDGLADNVVFRMAEDSKGRIWFNTFSGAINYYQDGIIYSIAANDELKKITNHSSNFFRTMCIGKNDTLYLGSGPNGYFYKIPPDNNYSKIIQKPLASDLKFELFSPECNSQFVYSYDNFKNDKKAAITAGNKSFSFETSQPSFPGVLAFAKCDGGYFFSNTTNQLLMIGKKGECITNKLKATNKIINSLFVDNQNNLWIGLSKGGVLFYKNADLHFAPEHYLSNKSVAHIYEDIEGGMWFATLEEGVFYSANYHIKILTNPFLNNNALSAFYVDSDNNLLAGTEKGDLYKLNYKNDSLQFVFKHFDSGISFITEENKNAYYLGPTLAEQSKVFKKEARILKEENYPYHDGRALFICNDTLLFVTSQGITYIKQNGKRFCPPIEIPGKLFKAIQTSKKEILLGCFNGLWELKNGKYALYKDTPELRNRINDIAEDKYGNIWVGTDKNGVICIDKSSKKTLIYSTKQGLPLNKINALTFDELNNIWTATNNGIACISYKDKKIIPYTVANGLLNDRVKKIICYGNELWMGTDAGICICNINELRKNVIPPNVVINTVFLNNLPLKKTGIPFNYKQDNLSFLFDGLSFKKNGGCSFACMLLGYDNAWHNLKDGYTNYTNLSPGDYTFLVSAINADGVYSKSPARFSFKINPPFWKTWWFILLVAVIWLFLTYQFIVWRIRIFKKRTEKKNLITKQLTEYQLTAIQAQMNPHFIFNVITSIQNFILDKDTDEAYDYLAQFARLIRLILQHSKENFVTIERELEMLKIYISLEQLRLNKSFDFIVHVSSEIDTSSDTLPVMLLQPYIENAIWHGIMPMEKSKKGIITLSFYKRDTQLVITIEDNGIGREKALLQSNKKHHSSMAMSLNQKRLDLFNAQLRIIDKHDDINIPTGTIIELTMKN